MFLRTRIQKREALVLPAQVSQPNCQNQRQKNHHSFPPTAASFRLIIFEQVIEIAGWRRSIRINA
jgi:hypothetical protein